MPLSCRYAGEGDVEQVVQLSAHVQAVLTASGSLQQIGPLDPAVVREAADSRHCFVADDANLEKQVLACALVHPIKDGFYSKATGFDIGSFESPWLYMHAVMLDPACQGRGSGQQFVTDAIKRLEDDSRYAKGTLFLGCWVGSHHLRRFYAKCGFDLTCIVPKEDYEVAVYSLSLK